MSQDLDGFGKAWHPCSYGDYMRCFEACLGICEASAKCTGFEFNEGGSEMYTCATYTGGETNLSPNQNSLTGWVSCLKTKRFPPPPSPPPPSQPIQSPKLPQSPLPSLPQPLPPHYRPSPTSPWQSPPPHTPPPSLPSPFPSPPPHMPGPASMPPSPSPPPQLRPPSLVSLPQSLQPPVDSPSPSDGAPVKSADAGSRTPSMETSSSSPRPSPPPLPPSHLTSQSPPVPLIAPLATPPRSSSSLTPTTISQTPSPGWNLGSPQTASQTPSTLSAASAEEIHDLGPSKAPIRVFEVLVQSLASEVSGEPGFFKVWLHLFLGFWLLLVGAVLACRGIGVSCGTCRSQRDHRSHNRPERLSSDDMLSSDEVMRSGAGGSADGHQSDDDDITHI